MVLLLLIFNLLISLTLCLDCPPFSTWANEHNLECFCNSDFEPSQQLIFEISCLGSFTIQYKLNNILRIECQDSNVFETNLFQHIKFKDASTFIFSYCDPPVVPLKKVLSDYQVQSLKFEASNNEFNWSIFEGLPLNRLNLRGNEIYSIPDNSFIGLTNITKLYLYENNLEEISSNLLSPLKNLTRLEINANQIINISENAFQNNINLTMLYISKNNLSTLAEGVFGNLENLELLDLSYNHLTLLPSKIFSKNKNLKTLSLKANKLKELDALLFAYLEDLNVLDLSANTLLQNLFGAIFGSLGNLKNISLANCNLKTISENIFENCTSLLSLDLKNNGLTNLPLNIFKTSKKINRLDLSYNDLSFLEDDVFSPLSNLKELILNNNNFTYLSERAFLKLYMLQKLTLASNNLTSIPSELINNMLEMESIDFSKNYISEIRPTNTKYYGFLYKLKWINLSFNNLTSIKDLDWSSYFNLEWLNLEYNQLTEFEVLIFSPNSPKIKLGHNNISIINISNYLFPYEDTKQPHKPTSFFFFPNPINCDCNFYKFVLYFSNMSTANPPANFPDFDKLACQQPKALFGQNILKISTSSFVCSFSEGCPKNCSCFKRASDDAHVINCQNINLGAIPTDISENITTLYLDDNSIDTIEVLNHPIFDNLKEIYLGNNRISSLDEWNHIPQSLRVISLKQNLLSSVPKQIIEFATSKKDIELYFGSNPWNCDCTFLEFKQWLTKNYRKVEDIANITCYSIWNSQNIDLKNISLTETTDETLCPVKMLSQTDLYITIGALVVLVILLLSMAIFYYRNKQTFIAYVFIHLHGVFLCVFSEEDLDEDKKYDAFVSYSATDMDVAMELIDKLEKMEPHFKLCVHERDWLPGNMISWNIANSVQNSRKTILVVSKTFLKSMWFQVEFHTAYYQMLQDRIDRLIVVIKGELPDKKEMDENLLVLLSTKTYLTWGERWFWEKLRYAMPHKATYLKPETHGLAYKPKPAILSNVETQMSTLMNIPTITTLSNKKQLKQNIPKIKMLSLSADNLDSPHNRANNSASNNIVSTQNISSHISNTRATTVNNNEDKTLVFSVHV